MKKELEGYGISTGTFLEKSEFVSALEKARKDYYGDENGMDDDGRRRRNKSCTNNNKSKKPREERIVEELENCKGMKVSELKKELEGLNLDISTFFEKSELVKVLADARVDGTATATTSSKASHDDDKNILSVDDVKDIYDIRSRYDAKYKCNNRFCTEVETKTNKVKFRECSQCQQAIYCSAECQKREWPWHKVLCQDRSLRQENDGVDAQLKQEGSPRQRMAKFIEQYSPLLVQASFFALRTGFGNNEDLYETHVANIILQDIPPSSNAKPPMLYIKAVLPVKIVDLPEFWKNRFQFGRRKMLQMIDMTNVYSGIYNVSPLVTYPYEEEGWVEAPAQSYAFARDKMTIHEDCEKLGSNLSKQLQQRALISQVIKYKQTINEMAMGKANDLRSLPKGIKSKIK